MADHRESGDTPRYWRPLEPRRLLGPLAIYRSRGRRPTDPALRRRSAGFAASRSGLPSPIRVAGSYSGLRSAPLSVWSRALRSPSPR